MTRRVCVRGTIMIGGQKIQAGLVHACKTAGITVEVGRYRITVEPGIIITAPHHQPRLPAAQGIERQPSGTARRLRP